MYYDYSLVTLLMKESVPYIVEDDWIPYLGD